MIFQLKAREKVVLRRGGQMRRGEHWRQCQSGILVPDAKQQGHVCSAARRPAPPQEPRDESGEERESWPRAQRSRNEDRGIQPHRCMANRWGDSGNSDRLYFGGSQITADGDYSHEIKRHLLLGRKAMANLDSILKSRDHYFANKGPSSQSYGFSSSHVWM